jgi:ferredoxin
MAEDVTITVEIDADVCAGHGRCYTLSPAHFAPDEDGQGRVIETTVHGSTSLHEIENAARLCPEQAIHVRIEG